MHGLGFRPHFENESLPGDGECMGLKDLVICWHRQSSMSSCLYSNGQVKLRRVSRSGWGESKGEISSIYINVGLRI